MSDLQVGDYVRWDVDVDKVYSKDTKTLVGKVGIILPPQHYVSLKINTKGHRTPAGFRDVQFTYKDKPFTVGNIPESELVKVDAPQ